jgi:hypothetical protein
VFRVTVSCEGIAPDAWPDAYEDVRAEFAERSWHRVVDVRWSEDALVLVAENDYDDDGEALADEFSDTVAAYAFGTPGIRIRIVSVETVGGPAA